MRSLPTAVGSLFPVYTVMFPNEMGSKQFSDAYPASPWIVEERSV